MYMYIRTFHSLSFFPPPSSLSPLSPSLPLPLSPSETLWVVVTVEDDGVSSLAQQLSSISTAEGQMDTGNEGGGEGTCTTATDRTNPFASPGSTHVAVSETHAIASEIQSAPDLQHSSMLVGSHSQCVPSLISDSQSSILGDTHSKSISGTEQVSVYSSDSTGVSNVLGSARGADSQGAAHSPVSATVVELHPLPGSAVDDMQS